MFDVLAFLYENSYSLEQYSDEESLSVELSQAGFDTDSIEHAFDWLKELCYIITTSPVYNLQHDASVRIYTEQEVAKVGSEGLAYLNMLYRAGHLSFPQRELIVDRVSALPDAPLGLSSLKIIALMVLWNQRVEMDFLVAEDLLGSASSEVESSVH